MRVINGGQTCKTIQETLNNPELDTSHYDSAYVMIRIYQLAESEKDFMRDITFATNSQNPVDLRDLKSNDELQKQLELSMRELGYTYKRQREEKIGGSSDVITSATVAEAVLAVWLKKPHHAKFRRREHFGKLYEDIFKNLNGAQAVLAVLIFRFVENERKRPSILDEIPDFLPYASHYLARIIGLFVIINGSVTDAKDISHREFTELVDLFEEKKAEFYTYAISLLKESLIALYGDREITLQQLSATFRRGDLLYVLAQHLEKDLNNSNLDKE